ncbi:hypothetical protein Rs2_01120 [Raphanus sativus]|uniref:Histone H2A.Z-specific chaperone CHZ1 n=1 Tax=Raphanus sativus TaxID=3726 RepID=A0A6J0K4F9_RAPSA|nr:histone H2A.Z-specific chaperone CHZ1 [Raphanus sativus]XP_056862941.1 histone H2A.Z-specific chaperone CHZ1-like [Raphanus sativus]KAJ4915567.1 hypothetical protein Rs2_01117 [Raphanus sativus]KAJ4915570.1 hypothetical protein Rs2_01120 [Raphanus sativus]
MADVENKPESSFPVKRRPDLCCQEQGNVSNKAQKLNPWSSSADSESGGEGVSGICVENLNSSSTTAGSVSEKDENVVSPGGDIAAEEKQEVGVREEEEDDRKGKVFSREDKGKGKLIEFDDSDEDDDEDGDEYDESELSDDALAEVDLDNILPSRTRRRSIQPGVYFSNDRR